MHLSPINQYKYDDDYNDSLSLIHIAIHHCDIEVAICFIFMGIGFEIVIDKPN